MKKSGVVEIRNLKTDRIWLFWADDYTTDCASQRFKLDLGMHECASLQKDYTEIGLEVFRFDLVEESSDKNRLEEIRNKTTNLYS
ncbi:MAG: hypothetical protein ACSW73_02185 [Spirochaetales bacterium]